MIGFIILLVIVVLIVLAVKNKSENTQSEEVVKQPETRPRPKKETKGHKVAGTSFRQDAFNQLNKELNQDYGLTKKELIAAGLVDKLIYQYKFIPEMVELIPEPTNEHDPKAIKVVVDGVHIGYIKKGSCAHIHKLIENDGIKSIEAYIYGGKYKVINSYYGEDDDALKYEFESGSDEYRAKIEILEQK